MKLTAEQISAIIGAPKVAAHEFTVDSISIDSRSSLNNSGTLFFALVGPNADAHEFIPELLEKGVRFFVVSKVPSHQKKGYFFLVENTTTALQKLAAWHRSTFNFPIIGITGSNGKTIVKEWLNFLLAPDFNIIKSPKSYNSQVGVPLSVLGINSQHNLGIFEAGISQSGEMEKLQAIIQPTLGILTNIGSAHDEGFVSRTEKLKEKTRLFITAKTTICEAAFRFSNTCFTWSFKESADVVITCTKGLQASTFAIKYQNTTFQAVIPFTDDASLENAATCLTTLLYLNYDPATICERLRHLYPVQMRLQIKNGLNRTIIIDDSYSSDFQSLKIALDFMESQGQAKKTVILSDIVQSGLSEEDRYGEIARMLINSSISRVFGIGKTISKYAALFPNAYMFASTQAFLEFFNTKLFQDETVLVKGARVFEFERIVNLLEFKTHETVFEINLNAISHNLSYYRSKILPETKLMVMVKAFGYGNGGFELARLLEHHKVDYLGVAFADEGISLKLAGIKLPIMVLNPEYTSFLSILEHNLEPEIYSMRGLRLFLRAASEKAVSQYPIHIKLDTGMHRLGFEEHEITELIDLLLNNSLIRVQSILSHMAASDDPALNDFSLEQIALFDKLSTRIMEALSINPIRHILNTSGISNFPQAQFNMVRLGIGLYGVSNAINEQQHLQNVGTLKSVISQIRTINEGESVGYSRKFIAMRKTKVATIPIGYADGINRHWGNQAGYVNIQGRSAPIIGSICMDMLMVDCTGIDCKEGDEVVILGHKPTVQEMAQTLDTIPYEILTSISQRVKRVYFRE